MFARTAARVDRFAGARPLLFAVLFGGAVLETVDLSVRYKGWRWALEMAVTPYLGIVPWVLR